MGSGNEARVPGTAVLVDCCFGASDEWREFRVVSTGRKGVTLEPVLARGDLARICGQVVIRCRPVGPEHPVELIGAVRHRSWLEEGRFGLGVEVLGYRVPGVDGPLVATPERAA